MKARAFSFPVLAGFLALALIVVPFYSASAQTSRSEKIQPRQDALAIPADRGAAALWQSLLKLHTRASMLMITAHPDDEDGATLAYESRGLGARVALLTLNRGEGGANVMSSDLWDALGLVRTEELLQADRYYGVQQYFSTVADYGFSKSLAEAKQKYTEDRLLYNVVRVVRITRPLVITSVFVGGPSDGHGQHQAAGMMAQEVFKAAGDPNVFPDQIKAGLRPWNPMKDYAHVPFFLEEGSVSPKGLYDYADHHWYPAGVQNYITGKWEPGAVSADVTIPVGDENSIIGLSYRQIAREGLGFQKSQNGGPAIPDPGPDSSAYHRFGSRIPVTGPEKSFYSGIDVSLLGIASLAKGEKHGFLTQGLTQINQLVEQAMTDFSPNNPGGIASTLAKGLSATNALVQKVNDSALSDSAKYNVLHELRVKQAQFNDALCQALGVSIVAHVAPEHPLTGPFARFFGTQPSFQMAIPGQQFFVKVHVADVGSLPVQIKNISLETTQASMWTTGADNPVSGPLDADHAMDARFHVTVPDDAGFTQPYFERPDIEQPYYDVLDKKYLNLPLTPYPLDAWVTMDFQGVELHLGEVVQTVKRDVGPGLVQDPMPVAPAISLTMNQSAGIVPLDKRSFTITALVHSNVKGPAKGTVSLDLPAGWQSKPASADFATAQEGEQQSVAFTVYPQNVEEKSYTVTAVATYAGHSYKQGYTTVGYQGLRPYFLYRPSTYTTTGTNVKVAPGLNVGYITGSGDDVPQSLGNLGIHVQFLTKDGLATGDLQKYNVILVGVRAYAVRDDLRTYNGRLLDYVKNGGVVIVQYQTPEFDHNFGPYPYSMTSDPEEVTDENSFMKILKPDNPVLSWPNKITEKDFQGWIEERGSKFMKSWDPHYEALLETHDPDQAPQEGGMLYAKYGKGIYVYTAYAFYRELPLGVPGAYRLFANLLSLAHNPHASSGAE
ncbi:MAG TPA: PIG-L family deacetylase [Acidobacteriaceae bacterium]|jgi:LmbE family N-acetylglucosaminyl deacetylase|nr:PIG-L family deacetylase [Acidobacteriaceae bacterium]